MWYIFGVEIDPSPIWTTLAVAFTTTLVLLIIGIPMAWKLARTQSRWKVFFEALVALPLVLPPTVLGFYLLISMNPNGMVADFLRFLGHPDGQLTFTFVGLVIGSVFYSLPFAVQPLMRAFEQVPQSLVDAAKTMRANTLSLFWQVVMPLSRRGFLTAATLAFAHTVGEFGVVLMVGGNIPHETRMVSIAIFDHVETLEYAQAHVLSVIMLIFSFSVLLVVYGLNRKFEVKIG
ncbi:MAG TPA: molybdate ABC transporter permease subunit [Thiotrichales bacterium]|nr:MAG: molybdenum ABC transporter permease subunit [Thiotrichales bacterium 35-46-9]OYZ41270.1 MAG: molybdenum ABC transporter permease subunit [Thiotrichales bacterium 24-47-4]OZA74306.1 MAG: molybdenum ABC transporter permease subunit [Thiotrichales bacterium 39-47-5]HQR82030.1 molybdate ABC transporter permease subunit [Thiotrichales bacterium]HQR95477.1 molybdate ABC transporter permease subunit [Thiotrichales bacterium]